MPNKAAPGIVLGLLREKEKGAAAPASAEEQGETGGDLDMAAQEVMEALTDGDATAFAAALRSFVELCKD